MPPLVSLQRAVDYQPDKLRKFISALLAPLGGIQNYVKQGDEVLLKPNLVAGYLPEKAVNTHPAIVQVVAEMIKDCGGKITVGDSPGLGSALRACKASGISKAVEKVGGKIIEFTQAEIRKSGSSELGLADMAQELKNFDLIINLPKFKTHVLATLTLGIKNCFGTIVGRKKFQWHYRAGHNEELFAKMLLNVYQSVAPRLTILDGIIAMEGNGPTSGKAKHLGILAASEDCRALDLVCCRLIGLQPEKLPILRAAAKDPKTLWQQPELVGEKIKFPLLTDFVLPQIRPFNHMASGFLAKFIRNLITAKPVVKKHICTACKACASLCPAQAIDFKENLPVINKDLCICCYCCHELCPQQAMELKYPLFARWIGQHD